PSQQAHAVPSLTIGDGYVCNARCLSLLRDCEWGFTPIPHTALPSGSPVGLGPGFDFLRTPGPGPDAQPASAVGAGLTGGAASPRPLGAHMVWLVGRGE
ncbi:MAG: hypothetical protein ACK56I_09230, partial [bacterium]